MAQSEKSSESVDGYSRRNVLFGAAATAMAVISNECPAAQEEGRSNQYGEEELIKAATKALADTMQALSGGTWASKIDDGYILVFRNFSLGSS